MPVEDFEKYWLAKFSDRLKEIVGDTKLSPTYCYCGAGFYKGLWEGILQKPVMVEILESVMKGDDVCKIAIHLP